MKRAVTALVLSLLSGGCGGLSAPAKLEKYDPATAAAKAIEIYDKDDDGKISANEVKDSPALATGGRRFDSNGDSVLTKDEIQARMTALEAQADYVGLDVRILSAGKPLVGAALKLIPEPFLGNGLPTFSGTTVDGGGCPLVSSGKQLPGIPNGLYRAQIVHAAQGINTVRGVEIADDTTGNRLEIAL
jgi:hypothetical protein